MNFRVFLLLSRVDISALPSVIKCVKKLFASTEPSYIYMDNGASFLSREFKQYLLKRGNASSESSHYHLVGNGQVEKTVGTAWKAIQWALSTRNVLLLHYETVLNDVLLQPTIPHGPCNSCPYRTSTDLPAGAAVTPHELAAPVSCGSSYLWQLFFFEII